VFKGIAKYYSFIHNHSKFIIFVHWILHYSCARLLAKKFKLGRIAKVFKKFGKSLTYFVEEGYKAALNKNKGKTKVVDSELFKTHFYIPKD
jgi:hypothetical protein